MACTCVHMMPVRCFVHTLRCSFRVHMRVCVSDLTAVGEGHMSTDMLQPHPSHTDGSKSTASPRRALRMPSPFTPSHKRGLASGLERPAEPKSRPNTPSRGAGSMSARAVTPSALTRSASRSFGWIMSTSRAGSENNARGAARWVVEWCDDV